MTDPSPTWWFLPLCLGIAIGPLAALVVRTQAAEQGAEMQRRCERYCLDAGLGHGTAEPRADACVCDDGGSQP